MVDAKIATSSVEIEARIVVCPMCPEEIKADKVQQHLDYYCLKREFPCPLCTKPQTLETVDVHLETCITQYTQNKAGEQIDEESEYGSEYESEEDNDTIEEESKE